MKVTLMVVMTLNINRGTNIVAACVFLYLKVRLEVFIQTGHGKQAGWIINRLGI